MSMLNVTIILQDDLSESRIAWFEGLSIEKIEDHFTRLSGEIPDYPALYGLLERIRDLNLHLLSAQVQSMSKKGTIK